MKVYCDGTTLSTLKLEWCVCVIIFVCSYVCPPSSQIVRSFVCLFIHSYVGLYDCSFLCMYVPSHLSCCSFVCVYALPHPHFFLLVRLYVFPTFSFHSFVPKQTFFNTVASSYIWFSCAKKAKHLKNEECHKICPSPKVLKVRASMITFCIEILIDLLKEC